MGFWKKLKACSLSRPFPPDGEVSWVKGHNRLERQRLKRCVQHGCRDKAGLRFLHQELRTGLPHANNTAANENMTTARRDSLVIDIGSVAARRVLDVPVSFRREEARVPAGHGLGPVRIKRDGTGGVATDDGLWCVNQILATRCLIFYDETWHGQYGWNVGDAINPFH